MTKFIPYEKLSKKQQKAVNAAKRKSWDGVNPVTRVSVSEKAYNRARARRRYNDSDAGSFLHPSCSFPLFSSMFRV